MRGTRGASLSGKMAELNSYLVTTSLAIRMRGSVFWIEAEGSKHLRIMQLVRIWVLKECGCLRKMFQDLR